MSDFIIPEGKKSGCLLRVSAPGQICPLFGEKIKVLSNEEIQASIDARKASGLRKRDQVKQILDQDGVGSCATESTTQGVMTTCVSAGRAFRLLNPWFLYFHSSGGVDRGSSIDTNLELARDIGIASEEVWPRSKGWRTKPSDAAYADALTNRIYEFYDAGNVQEVRTALALGFLVVFGHDSHSELMLELEDLNSADVANSWATSWGDKGFHPTPFPLNRINWNYGCFIIRVAQ
jgi:hypothetical protein